MTHFEPLYVSWIRLSQWHIFSLFMCHEFGLRSKCSNTHTHTHSQWHIFSHYICHEFGSANDTFSAFLCVMNSACVAKCSNTHTANDTFSTIICVMKSAQPMTHFQPFYVSWIRHAQQNVPTHTHIHTHSQWHIFSNSIHFQHFYVSWIRLA